MYLMLMLGKKKVFNFQNLYSEVSRSMVFVQEIHYSLAKDTGETFFLLWHSGLVCGFHSATYS